MFGVMPTIQGYLRLLEKVYINNRNMQDLNERGLLEHKRTLTDDNN
jgi:hypothetical protein